MVVLSGACGNSGSTVVGASPSSSLASEPTIGRESQPNTTAVAEGDGEQPAEPAHAGFDLALRSGSWWDFGYSRSERSFAQDSGTRSSDTSGRFRIILGDEGLIDAVTMYAVHIVPLEGDDPDFDVTRWRSIGVDGNDLVGSTDGGTVQTILAATAGVQAGGGFFAAFGDDELLTAVVGRLDIELIESDALVLGASFEEGRCEYFESVGNICTGQRDTSLARSDYFKAGVGPLGHKSSFSFEDCGGGFCSGFSEQVSIGLLDHSLEGEAPYVPEVVEADGTPVGFLAVVDDTGSITVDIPLSWADIATQPALDNETREQSPTILAAVSLEGFLDSYEGSGLFFQALPVLAPSDLTLLLDEVSSGDAAACSPSQPEEFSGPNHQLLRMVMLDCDGTDTDLVWIVGELDRPEWSVVVVIQLASRSDQDYLETIISSLRVIE